MTKPIDVAPLSPPTIVAAPAPLKVRVQLAASANYSRAYREPSLIVLHATCGSEGTHADRDAAAMIARPLRAGDRTSFHYAVDADSATRCVPDLLTAWHAGRTANSRGIGVELCGQASQTRAQWLDPTSLATLAIAARLVADLCREYKIPAHGVDVSGLVRGDRGITTHSRCSAAWDESDHWDPGPGFPFDAFVAAVRAAAV